MNEHQKKRYGAARPAVHLLLRDLRRGVPGRPGAIDVVLFLLLLGRHICTPPLITTRQALQSRSLSHNALMVKMVNVPFKRGSERPWLDDQLTTRPTLFFQPHTRCREHPHVLSVRTYSRRQSMIHLMSRICML